jgi:hypothetical protein
MRTAATAPVGGEVPGGPQKVRSFDRKGDAERFLDRIRGDLARVIYVDPADGKIPFREYGEQWRARQIHRPSTAAPAIALPTASSAAISDLLADAQLTVEPCEDGHRVDIVDPSVERELTVTADNLQRPVVISEHTTRVEVTGSSLP